MLKVVGIGRLGRDPEMKYLDDGKPVCNFTVAFDVGYGERKKTAWVRFSAFGKTAELCNQYLKKGSQAYVEGEIFPDAQTGGPRIYTNKEGVAIATYEATLNTVKFIGPKKEGEKATEEEPWQ